jgi:predicted outer membrane repeat protein
VEEKKMKRIFATITTLLVLAASAWSPVPARALSMNLWIGFNTQGGGSCASPDYQVDGIDDNVQFQNALNMVAENGALFVCEGTYVFGDWVGTPNRDVAIEGVDQETTIIDGNGHHIFDAVGDAWFSNLTFKNGVNGGDYAGGAIWSYSPGAYLSVQDSTFINNSAYDGGAIAAYGDFYLNRLVFSDNEAFNSGGAIVLGEGYGSVLNSTFMHNHTRDEGGAISTSWDLDGPDKSLVVQNSTFTGNSSGDWGGAIGYESGELTVTGSTFTGNSALKGGAIDTWGGNVLTLVASTFTRNKATAYGGAISLEDEVLSGHLIGNRFSSNRASRGRTVYLYGEKTAMRRSLRVWSKARVTGAEIYIH